MLSLRGVSELHWRSQNRLATPVVSPSDSTALIYSSTISFGPQDSDAWWIAYDAIQVANRELQTSNALLRDSKPPHLAISRIEGAISPSAMARHVSATGWKPVQAEIKISQIGKVVEMFGGEQLYGNDLSVALRELIQNASDAVRFRRELEPHGSSYEGKITVRLNDCKDSSGNYWLDVEDDGLGMSEAVLTGPLIDFGSSYMSSALVKYERPGLLSKGKKRIGQFGIGFFSSFMLSDEILVTSRPFDTGSNEQRTLHFKDGLGHRPVLLSDQNIGISFATSTRIRLKISEKNHKKLLRLPSNGRGEGNAISLQGLVGVICPMLDVDIAVDTNGNNKIIHHRKWFDEDRLNWLRRITAAEARNDIQLDKHLTEAAPLLDFIDPTEPNAGLACITSSAAGGVSTVGTLRESIVFNQFRDEFAGVIDYTPADPRRSRGAPKAGYKISTWASTQAIKHNEAHTKSFDLSRVAQRVADFGGDASPIALMLLNRELKDLPTIFNFIKDKGAVYAPLKYADFNNKEIAITVVRERHSGLLDHYRPGELEYLLPTIEACTDASSKLYRIPGDDNDSDIGFYSLLSNFAKKQGFALIGEVISHIEFAKYVGPDSPREDLEHGKIIGCSGLKIHIKSPD